MKVTLSVDVWNVTCTVEILEAFVKDREKADFFSSEELPFARSDASVWIISSSGSGVSSPFTVMLQVA